MYNCVSGLNTVYNWVSTGYLVILCITGYDWVAGYTVYIVFNWVSMGYLVILYITGYLVILYITG